MLLTCSANMQKALGVSLDAIPEGDPLFMWHSNTLQLNGKDSVVLMNSESRFFILLYNLSPAQFWTFPEDVPMYIRKTLESYPLTHEIVDAYIKDCGHTMLVRNNSLFDNSRLVKSFAYLKNYCNMETELDPSATLQVHLTHKLNGRMVFDYGNTLIYPRKRLFSILRRKYGFPLYDTHLCKLKMTLDVPGYRVVRTLLVPEFYPFTRFHRVIHTSFQWRYYHPCSFGTEDGKRYTIPEMEQFGTVREYFEQNPQLSYTYHNWNVSIQWMETKEDRKHGRPICLYAAGISPEENFQTMEEYLEWVKVNGKEFLERQKKPLTRQIDSELECLYR